MDGPHKQTPAGFWGRTAVFFRGIGSRLRSLAAFPFQVLHWEIRRLRTELTEYGSATTESMAHVGVRLRSIEESLDRLIEGRGGATSAELAFALRSLAAIDPPARLLLVGSRHAAVGPSLADLGYEVTMVGDLPDDLADLPRFDAILCGSLDDYPPAPADRPTAPTARAAALERFATLLRTDGLLVFALPAGAPTNGEWGLPVLDLLDGWMVDDQALVQDRAIAMVAARPQQPA